MLFILFLGENECKGNLVETCFINLVNFTQNSYMDFLIEYEGALDKKSSDPYGTAQTLIEYVLYNILYDILLIYIYYIYYIGMVIMQ